MKLFIRFIALFFVLVHSILLAYMASPPSVYPKFVLATSYDFFDFSASSSFSIVLDSLNISFDGTLPFTFNLADLRFKASIGYALLKTDSSLLFTFLSGSLTDDLKVGWDVLFAPVEENWLVFAGFSYALAEDPYFLLESGCAFKVSDLPVNLGVLLKTDFQTKVTVGMYFGIEYKIGDFLMRASCLFDAPHPFTEKSRNLISLGLGFQIRNALAYDISVAKSSYFEDETVSITARRVSGNISTAIGGVTLKVLNALGQEVISKSFTVEQSELVIREKLARGKYTVSVHSSGNFEVRAPAKSFVVKSIPNVAVEIPSALKRAFEYKFSANISSRDNEPVDISVRVGGSEVLRRGNVTPNRTIEIPLKLEKLGPQKVEIFVDDRLVVRKDVVVQTEVNAEWLNPPNRVLTLRDMTLSPPKFKFTEIFDRTQVPFANQEIVFVVQKEGSERKQEVLAVTDREGIASVPFSWETGVFSIDVKPVSQEFARITFSGRKDFMFRIEPTPYEMILSTNESKGIFVDPSQRLILMSFDKRSYNLNFDLQDELGERIRRGAVRLSIWKREEGMKLRDASADFGFPGVIDLTRYTRDAIEIPIEISSRVETGEYYFFFELYVQTGQRPQSIWVDMYKVIVYKEAIVTVNNLTIPGIVQRDVIFRGEPNRLKFDFMWKDGEPVRNAKVVLRFGEKQFESFTNDRGGLVVVTPDSTLSTLDVEYAIFYGDLEIISGLKKLRVQNVERKISIPNDLNLRIKGGPGPSREISLLMGNEYEFTLDDGRTQIVSGRVKGYELTKILNEVYLVRNPLLRTATINFFDDQKRTINIAYSVYGVLPGGKGQEFFLGTFRSGDGVQIPIGFKNDSGEEIFFAEFFIVPAGDYFPIRLPSIPSGAANYDLKPARKFIVDLNIIDDEGTRFVNPARYSLYLRERGVEYFLGNTFSGLGATILLPSSYDLRDAVNLLKIYRKGLQLEYTSKDVQVDERTSRIGFDLKILNQTAVAHDFNLEVLVDRQKVETSYTISAQAIDTFYGIPMYSKTVYERGRGKNFYGPGNNFELHIHLPDLGITTFIEDMELSPGKTKLPLEVSELTNVTLCHVNFEDIQYYGVRATVKVNGREIWKDVINRNATFPLPDGLHIVEISIDKYASPIKIIKFFDRNQIERVFDLKLTATTPNAPIYSISNILRYPNENSTYKLYSINSATGQVYQVPVDLLYKAKYLKIEVRGTLFVLDNAFGFEVVPESENRYRIKYGASRKYLKFERGLVSIEFHPVDDDRVVLGFKPSGSSFAENVRLAFRGFQEYMVVTNKVPEVTLTDTPPIRLRAPAGAMRQAGELKFKILGYTRDETHILPLDISQLDERHIVSSDVVSIDGLIYVLSLRADPVLGDRTQRVILKQPGKYFVEFVGVTYPPVLVNFPESLNTFEKGADGSYLIP